MRAFCSWLRDVVCTILRLCSIGSAHSLLQNVTITVLRRMSWKMKPLLYQCLSNHDHVWKIWLYGIAKCLPWSSEKAATALESCTTGANSERRTFFFSTRLFTSIFFFLLNRAGTRKLGLIKNHDIAKTVSFHCKFRPPLSSKRLVTGVQEKFSKEGDLIPRYEGETHICVHFCR